MLDAITLDQIRTFLAAAESGNFSAAGRKLRRAQSVASPTLANRESQSDVGLLDRVGRYPRLTEQGRSLQEDAHAVADNMGKFKARARSIKEGIEPELSVVMDALYPMDRPTAKVGHCLKHFPDISFRLHAKVLGGVIKPVVDRMCCIGVIGFLPAVPDELVAEPLMQASMATVVTPHHPLAKIQGALSSVALCKHIQLVLTDRAEYTAGRNYSVVSPLTWRLEDMGVKHAFLLAGFGWAHMPLHMIEGDLAQRRLVEIRVVGDKNLRANISMRAIYRKDSPPGPVGRSVLSRPALPPGL